MRALVFLALASLACASFVNKNVERTIELTSHTPRHTIKITVDGSDSKGYLLAFPSKTASSISWIEASDENGNKLDVSVDSPSDAKKDTAYFRVKLGNTKTFSVYLVQTHAFTALPAKIAQADSQKMVYADNHFFYSPYKTDAQRTEVKLPSTTVDSHSEEKPTLLRGKEVVYGPYSDKAAYSSSPLRIHFEHNTPFFAATSLLKEIEVSLWGNVAVEEHYDIRHTGAELKGFFSRLDMQRSQSGNAPAAIRAFKADLPRGAQDVYYRDVIGNISSSHIREGEDGPEFEIIPRFPLFGGWKVQFYFGYNLPLNNYLFSDDNGRYHLNITYGSPIEEIVVDDFTLKIILPEGSSNFAVNAPFAVGEQSSETRFTYLDRTGRHVIVIHKRNVVSDHDIFFQVSFDFTGIFIWHEPLLLIVGFFAIFALCIVRSVLFDSGDKVAELLSEFKSLQAKRNAARRKMEAAHSRLLQGGGQDEYKHQLKQAFEQLGDIARESKEVENQLGSLGAEAASAIIDVRNANREEAQLDESRATAFSAASAEKPVDEASLKRFHSRAETISRSLKR